LNKVKIGTLKRRKSMGIRIIYNNEVDSVITAMVSKNRVSLSKDSFVKVLPIGANGPEVFCTVCSFFYLDCGYRVLVYDHDELQFEVINH